MTLLSAAEDLSLRTLGSIGSVLGKFLYLAGLQDGNGRYCHWGFSRTHGEEQFQEAARKAHLAALEDVLQKPIRELWEEILSQGNQGGLKHQKFAQIADSTTRLLPWGSSRLAELHLNSVLRALAELERAGGEGSNCPAA